METLQDYRSSISSQVSSVPAQGNFLSVPFTPVAIEVVKMPFSLKDPKMLYNQKSFQHALKCSLLCLEREQLLSCAHQQQHTAISKWTISILTETTGTNLDQNNVVALMHLCPEYCPSPNPQKDLPTVNWSLLSIFFLCFLPIQKQATAVVCCHTDPPIVSRLA